MRRSLSGEVVSQFQNTIGQSYLNYVAAPDYANAAGPQHNAHGYRGKQLAVAKPPDVVRVICLGGSTTYGWGVAAPADAWPAQLEQILNQLPPFPGKRIEVLNGGIPWGTSAEMLTHYHFKYHYYDPDVVIVHAGLNDGQAFDLPRYQPDYSHWRQQMPPGLVLPRPTRWLLRSGLLSLFIVPALYGRYPELPLFVKWFDPVPTIPWYDGNQPDRSTPENVPAEKIAFVHNLRALVREAKEDGALVALMPERFRPDVESNPTLERKVVEEQKNSIRYTQYDETLLKQLADEERVLFVPFPTSGIELESWTDVMHLDAKGEKAKAEQMATFLRPELARRSPEIRTSEDR